PPHAGAPALGAYVEAQQLARIVGKAANAHAANRKRAVVGDEERAAWRAIKLRQERELALEVGAGERHAEASGVGLEELARDEIVAGELAGLEDGNHRRPIVPRTGISMSVAKAQRASAAVKRTARSPKRPSSRSNAKGAIA